MSDYEELRDEMQYYENEHYNELRKLEGEEKNKIKAIIALCDISGNKELKTAMEIVDILLNKCESLTARAEKAEAELKEAVEFIEKMYQYMKSGMLPMAKKELSRYIANKEDGKDG